MRRSSVGTTRDELRPEYDLSKLKGAVRGKYRKQAVLGSNLVLIEADLAKAFPSEEAVNRALRLLLSAADAATSASRRRPAGSERLSHGVSSRKRL